MRIVRTISELRAVVKSLRDGGHRIGFVPTMGYLHEGHASLIRQSSARCGATVVSVFVNPIQFGPQEDLAKYPRDLERDQNLCLKLGVDVLFLPEPSELYPTGFNTFVEPGPMGDVLCGSQRPGHFRGVATVVAKFFNMVQPDLAFFGQKDLQQAVIVRRMARDLNMPVDILVAPTLREADGLALSSRNSYLSAEERVRALGISRGLFAAEAAFQAGERKTAKLVSLAKAELSAADEIHYCSLVDAQSLDPLGPEVTRDCALCVAVRIGGTRLIDNMLLSPSPEGAQLLSRLE
ncbi:MAG TPA: pantoate--beta-alanine ligase [Holophaga sp.]|jgi:pantoate--beta-alanine ligase|nr:pantoate--beta-alanine ligase [Holophaga sp.]